MLRFYFVSALDGLKSDVYYYGKRRKNCRIIKKNLLELSFITETSNSSTMKLVIFISLVSVATFAEALKEGDCEGK